MRVGAAGVKRDPFRTCGKAIKSISEYTKGREAFLHPGCCTFQRRNFGCTVDRLVSGEECMYLEQDYY